MVSANLKKENLTDKILTGVSSIFAVSGKSEGLGKRKGK